MLKIIEVENSKDLSVNRQHENVAHDYLYILKYNNTFLIINDGVPHYMNSIIKCTKKEYDALAEIDNELLYMVSTTVNNVVSYTMYYGGVAVSGSGGTSDSSSSNITISPNANNALVKSSNGYYVPAFLTSKLATNALVKNSDGYYTPAFLISKQINNALVKYSDGYYAPKLPVNYATTENIDSAKDEFNVKLIEQNRVFNERYDVITEKIQGISSNVSKFTTHEFVGINTNLISVIDISTLYSLTSNVILNLEFMIKNNSDIDMLTIKISENETETLVNTLTKSEVQKYKLPNTPNIEIFIQGNYSLFLYVNYI